MCAAVAVSVQAQVPKTKAKPTPKPVPKALQVNEAFFAGRAVKFQSPPEGKASRALLVGPWNLGEKVSPGNNDLRPNLYFVFPGTQHRAEGRPDFDNNAVLSAVPKDASNFDVYWVVALDPTVDQDFTSEQQIIMATQSTFNLPENFPFEQIPSAGFLRTFLKVNDIAGLQRFSRPDGELPRVAIVPAKVTVKALAEEIDEGSDTSTAEKN
jgi:hypothetical protein